MGHCQVCQLPVIAILDGPSPLSWIRKYPYKGIVNTIFKEIFKVEASPTRAFQTHRDVNICQTHNTATLEGQYATLLGCQSTAAMPRM